MSYIRYNHTHTRERSRSRDRSPIFTTRPLVRRNSKRQRADLYDDDDFDDYPYTSPSKPSRALTIREPNQLEKLNIWSSPDRTTRHRHHHHHHNSHSDNEDEDVEEDFFRNRYRHIHRHSFSRPHDDSSHDSHDHNREFRLNIKTAVSIPRRSNSFSQQAMSWPGDWFRSRSREKWTQEDWEARERQRDGDGFWDDEPKIERKITYRRIKRTRTNEFKPLSGFGRF